MLFNSKSIQKLFLLSMLLVTLPEVTLAALPTAQAPTRGEGTSLMQTLQNYAFDGFTLLGLVLCALGFFTVGRHAIGTYHEIHAGKAKWADLGATVVAGIALIGATIYLVTMASNIL